MIEQIRKQNQKHTKPGQTLSDIEILKDLQGKAIPCSAEWHRLRRRIEAKEQKIKPLEIRR